MIRFALLLLLLLCAPGHAEAAAPDFDAKLATDVYAAALTFMSPRILEPVPIAQLTQWGLRGLTAIDPDLSVGSSNGALVLALRDRILLARPIPADQAPLAWSTVATDLAAAAWASSAAIRRAGTEGVIQSFFDELFNHLDPYSRYVAPGEAEEDRDRRTGQAGIGVEIVQQRGGAIVVASVISDGPAGAAGIRPGDRILSVDGQAIRGADADAVGDLLGGPDGSSLTIGWRGRDGRVRSATLDRATVPPQTVFAERAGILLLLRLTAFSRMTDERLAGSVARGLAGGRPAQGLVLDLRGNRGGLLRQAVAVADMLLPEGVTAITAGRDPEADRTWRSAGGDLAAGLPIVVIVDGRTASAAEILAAALADRGRAVVVGSSTLGKGLVQTIAPMPGGGELFVTWSRVLAPLGWPIQGLGVLPQVCTSLGQRELDQQLDALSAGRAPMARALALHNQARAPLPAAEILALRSACPASEGRDADLVTARFLIGNPGAYATALLPPLRDAPAGR